LSFESIFFGPGNDISWEQINNGTLAPAAKQSLQPFLDSVRGDADVAILPRPRGLQPVVWYVLCRSARSSRFARDELRGFLGPTYCDVRMDSTSIDLNDSIDASVHQEYGLNAFKLEVPHRLREAARNRLTNYLSLRIERPNRLTLLIRTAGQILKDFEYALLAGSVMDATARIEELRNGGYLSATNVLFLEVRAMAANRDWDGIMNHRDLGALLAIQRPLRVTEALVKTAYSVKLKGFEENNDPEGAIEAFKPVYQAFSDIYRFRGKMDSPEVDASFLLSAAVNTSQNPAIAAEIIDKAEQRHASNLEYLRLLSRFIPGERPSFTADLKGTQLAFGLGDIERAAQMAMILPASYERTALLLRCARELETLESAQIALHSFHNLSDTEQRRISNNLLLSKILGHFTELSVVEIQSVTAEQEATPLPTDWETWFLGLAQESTWAGALEAAKLGSQEWDLVALVSDQERIQRLSDLILEDRSSWARTAFRDSLPHLIEFFRLGEADARLRGVYDALFLAVSVDDEISINQMHVLNRLADMRLELGTSLDEYAAIAEELRSTIYRLDSPAVIDRALEACEILVSHPCGSSEKRLAVFAATAASLSKWHRRASSAQLTLFAILCEELGTQLSSTISIPEIQGDQDDTVWTSLAGFKIALYSLQEGAVRRAALLLKKMIGDTKIDIFSDHVGGSPALRTAAQQADIFVITTAAAKHSATTFIEAKRPKALPTLYANGQGTSSIIQTFTRYLGASS
jgi:Arc/MetJ family transcription regulator